MVHQIYFAITPNSLLLSKLDGLKVPLDGSERALYSKDCRDRVSQNLNDYKNRAVAIFLAVFCDSLVDRGFAADEFNEASFSQYWELTVFNLCEDMDEVIVPGSF